MFEYKNEYIYALAFAVFGGASFFDLENINVVLGVIGALFTAAIFIFKKINKIVDSYNKLTDTVGKIHSEIFIDDNASIKDIVMCLNNTLERIETTQKILEQRSRSSLHYNDHAMFETDKHGSLIWSNDKFCVLSGLKHDEILGNDWYSIIDKEKREFFIEEFDSCLKMCRKLDVETTLYNGKNVKFYGQPYKIADIHQEGFLFKVTLQ